MTAPREPLALEWAEVGDVVVAHFTTTALLDIHIIQRTFEECDRLLATGRTKMVLNFRNLTAFASYAIGKLNAVNNRFAQQGGRLVLCELTPVLNEIIDLMNLRRLFVIVPTEREALDSFS